MALDFIRDDGTRVDFELQRGLDQLRRHFEQLFGEWDQLIRGQSAMPVIHRLGQRMGDAGAHPDRCGLVDAEPHRDPVGADKADAADVAGEAVRVFRDQL